MAVHVAILKWPYIGLILDGSKTMESRLTKTARSPYQKIKPGERIFFKASSGPYLATAVADTVAFYDKLTPRKVAALSKHFNKKIRGQPDYWKAKRDSRYATLITLRGIKPTATGPKIPPSRGKAWFVLDSESSPKSFQVILTEGALRNRYVRVPLGTHHFPPSAYGGVKVAQAGKPISLVMPNGDTVRTDLIRGGMFRWRGWGYYFLDHQMQPDDAVRFVQLTPRRYRVSFVEHYNGPRTNRNRKATGS